MVKSGILIVPGIIAATSIGSVNSQFGLPSVGEVIECFDSELLNEATDCVAGVVVQVGVDIAAAVAGEFFGSDEYLGEAVCEIVQNGFTDIVDCALLCEAAEDIFCDVQALPLFDNIRPEYEENNCIFDPERICVDYAALLVEEANNGAMAQITVSSSVVALSATVAGLQVL